MGIFCSTVSDNVSLSFDADIFSHNTAPTVGRKVDVKLENILKKTIRTNKRNSQWEKKFRFTLSLTSTLGNGGGGYLTP